MTNIVNKNTLAGDISTANIPTYGQAIGCYNGTINITGGTVNITGGTGSINNCIVVRLNNPGVVNITGLNSLVINPSGTSSSCYGIYNNGISGVINVSANNIDIYGGNGSNNHMIYMGNSSLNSVNVNGIRNIYLGSGDTSYGIYNNINGTINYTGSSIILNNSYQQYGVYNASTGIINLSATTISGSSLLNTYSIYSTTAGIINVTADTISSSNNTPAIYSTNATATNNIVYGNLNFTNGVSPVYFVPNATSKLVANTSSNTYLSILGTDNNYKTFVSSGFTGLNPFVLPVSGNVRSNIIYGYSASTTSFTGTSIVPLASAVTYGTLFDNTTGTSIISVYDFGNSLTKSGQTV